MGKKQKILGWFLTVHQNGYHYQLIKCNNLKSLAKQNLGKLGNLEKNTGKLMHAIGIPNRHGLLSLIIAMVATKSKNCNYKDQKTKLNQATQQALQDWIWLLPIALHNPLYLLSYCQLQQIIGAFVMHPNMEWAESG